MKLVPGNPRKCYMVTQYHASLTSTLQCIYIFIIIIKFTFVNFSPSLSHSLYIYFLGTRPSNPSQDTCKHTLSYTMGDLETNLACRRKQYRQAEHAPRRPHGRIQTQDSGGMRPQCPILQFFFHQSVSFIKY